MDNKKKITGLVLVIALLIIIIIGASYAWLTMTIPGTKRQVLRVGGLNVVLDEGNSLTLSDTRPMKDSTGLAQEGFTFSIVNKGAGNASYEVYLDDDTIETNQVRLVDTYVKYALDVNGTAGTAAVLSSRKLYTGTIAIGATDNFILRVWVNDDVDADLGGQVFKTKLRVEVTGVTS